MRLGACGDEWATSLEGCDTVSARGPGGGERAWLPPVSVRCFLQCQRMASPGVGCHPLEVDCPLLLLGQ
jgi:hypothetical protein